MSKYMIATALSLVIGSATLSQPALAADPDITTQSTVVSYADLDLAHQAGVQTLLHRIRGAAKSVCGSGAEGVDTIGAYGACIKLAQDRAVNDLNMPTVTAAYGGERQPVRLASRGGEG